MSQEARDSGIIADNDNDSLSSTSSMTRDRNQLSYVQRLRKQFEILAKEQEREFHSECNWWLDESEEARKGDGENVVAKEKAHESRKATSAPSTPVKSPLIMPQLSYESRKTPSTPSTPVKSSPPATVQEVPIFILNDGEDDNDDSFDSDSSDEEEEMIADEAQVEEANLDVGNFRHSNNSFKLSPK